VTYDSKTNNITLGRNANETDTMVDLGLSWVYELRADAGRSNAPSSIVADWIALEAWLGCAGRELNQDDHAKIGDAFRSYFVRCKAPSAEMESAFRHFAEQAKRSNRVGVTAPLQIEGVFDRMLATDEEIQSRRQTAPRQVKAESHIGTVTHYANNKFMCCCSIKLASGERVFISIASAPTPSIKIQKMALFGILPVQTIWEYNPVMAGGYDAYVRKMMMMFQDPLSNEPKHPLDIRRDRLLPCRSIAEVRDSLLSAERRAAE
jgi:hypothetical protein